VDTYKDPPAIANTGGQGPGKSESMYKMVPSPPMHMVKSTAQAWDFLSGRERAGGDSCWKDETREQHLTKSFKCRGKLSIGSTFITNVNEYPDLVGFL
jgi:hypothetical protein